MTNSPSLKVVFSVPFPSLSQLVTSPSSFPSLKVASDINNLYHGSMGSNARGGITRSGTSEIHAYAVKAFMGDKAVNWYAALRFCNWLHNRRPTGLQDSTRASTGSA